MKSLVLSAGTGHAVWLASLLDTKTCTGVLRVFWGCIAGGYISAMFSNLSHPVVNSLYAASPLAHGLPAATERNISMCVKHTLYHDNHYLQPPPNRPHCPPQWTAVRYMSAPPKVLTLTLLSPLGPDFPAGPPKKLGKDPGRDACYIKQTPVVLVTIVLGGTISRPTGGDLESVGESSRRSYQPPFSLITWFIRVLCILSLLPQRWWRVYYAAYIGGLFWST